MYYVLTTNGEPEDMYPLYDLTKFNLLIVMVFFWIWKYLLKWLQ